MIIYISIRFIQSPLLSNHSKIVNTHIILLSKRCYFFSTSTEIETYKCPIDSA